MERRTALGLLAATAAGAATLPAPALAAKRTAAFEPTDPAQLALAFRKLAYSADDSLTFWWMHGTRYGVVGSVATPFWEMYVGAWFRTRDLPDGRYEVKMVGANFYTPPGETRLLEEFANPYTGKTVAVPFNKPRASVTVFDQRGGSPFEGSSMPGMKRTVSKDIGPAWVQGDEVAVRGDLMLHAEPLEPGKRTFTVNDWSTYVGKLADVTNPKLKNPPSTQFFVDVLDFPGWLQMGDQSGTFVSRCHGRKVFSYGDMPAVWRTHFERKYPDVAKDPDALLKG